MRVMGAIFDTIRNKLNDAFDPIRLEIEDDSARHHGHAGATPGGESHFNVVIEAAAFAGAALTLRFDGVLLPRPPAESFKSLAVSPYSAIFLRTSSITPARSWLRNSSACLRN